MYTACFQFIKTFVSLIPPVLKREKKSRFICSFFIDAYKKSIYILASNRSVCCLIVGIVVDNTSAQFFIEDGSVTR